MLIQQFQYFCHFLLLEVIFLVFIMKNVMTNTNSIRPNQQSQTMPKKKKKMKLSHTKGAPSSKTILQRERERESTDIQCFQYF